MTHLKTKLATAAAVIAMAVTPAMANHHGGDMKKDGKHMMKKEGTMMSSEMTAEQRMAAERRILSSMSDADRKAYVAMTPEGRKAMMNKKLMGDYRVHSDNKMTEPMNSGAVKSMAAEETLGMTKDGMAPSKVNDTAGEVLQAGGQPDPQMDEELVTHDGDLKKKDVLKAQDSDGMLRDNAIAVPGSNMSVTTVSCPIGTTAQTNGTCLITGNYQY